VVQEEALDHQKVAVVAADELRVLPLEFFGQDGPGCKRLCGGEGWGGVRGGGGVDVPDGPLAWRIWEVEGWLLLAALMKAWRGKKALP
jgi:hypothetical protein